MVSLAQLQTMPIDSKVVPLYRRPLVEVREEWETQLREQDHTIDEFRRCLSVGVSSGERRRKFRLAIQILEEGRGALVHRIQRAGGTVPGEAVGGAHA